MRTFLGLAACLVLAAPSLTADPLLTLKAPDRTLSLTLADLAGLPRTELTAVEPHAQTTHRYAGVRLHDLATRLGVPAGRELRGAAQQLAVLVRGSDGYAVLFSVAELDPAYGQTAALLSDREDGAPWSERHGPLRLIVPGEQFAARWVRNVVAIEVITVGPVVPRPPKPASP